jgi:peptide/nickel transport system permease protein
LGSPQKAWSVFWSSNTSRVGVILLAIQVLLSLYVLFSYPLDFGTRYWNNPAYWADNPREAPPAWTNLFTSRPAPTHTVVAVERPGELEERVFEYVSEEFPSFVSVKVSSVTYMERPPVITFELVRPDGEAVVFYRVVVSPPLPGEERPYRRHHETPLTAFLSNDPYASQLLSSFLESRYGFAVPADALAREGVEKALFGMPVEGVLKPVKGLYRLVLRVERADQDDVVGWVVLIVGGRVYGFLGTDRLGRDLATGLLFGFPVSLLIGVVTAVLTTGIGSAVGMASGYVGGKLDEAVQRVCDILNNIPLLPLLIFFTFILKPSIWIIVLILVVFGWSGLAIVVRSIVLQARTAQFVEAAESLGVGRGRILTRHIMPQIAPFLISQMVFSTPSAILAEASLSFLGLGDPSLPSWGQMLEYAFRSGGVNLGLWWWILPPGLLIVFTAFTFVLISLGLEPVVSPRLRRVRV